MEPDSQAGFEQLLDQAQTSEICAINRTLDRVSVFFQNDGHLEITQPLTADPDAPSTRLLRYIDPTGNYLDVLVSQEGISMDAPDEADAELELPADAGSDLQSYLLYQAANSVGLLLAWYQLADEDEAKIGCPININGFHDQQMSAEPLPAPAAAGDSMLDIIDQTLFEAGIDVTELDAQAEQAAGQPVTEGESETNAEYEEPGEPLNLEEINLLLREHLEQAAGAVAEQVPDHLGNLAGIFDLMPRMDDRGEFDYEARNLEIARFAEYMRQNQLDYESLYEYFAGFIATHVETESPRVGEYLTREPECLLIRNFAGFLYYYHFNKGPLPEIDAARAANPELFEFSDRVYERFTKAMNSRLQAVMARIPGQVQQTVVAEYNSNGQYFRALCRANLPIGNLPTDEFLAVQLVDLMANMKVNAFDAAHPGAPLEERIAAAQGLFELFRVLLRASQVRTEQLNQQQ